MLLSTKYFGEIEVEQDKVIFFEEGLPGFEDKKEFVILNNYDTEDPVPFMWLQSTEDQELAFVITIPFLLKPDYEFMIPSEVAEQIDLKAPESAGVYTICKISGAMDSMTFNLRSPIVINTENKKAVQYVMPDTRYTTKEMFKNL